MDETSTTSSIELDDRIALGAFGVYQRRSEQLREFPNVALNRTDQILGSSENRSSATLTSERYAVVNLAGIVLRLQHNCHEVVEGSTATAMMASDRIISSSKYRLQEFESTSACNALDASAEVVSRYGRLPA